MALVAPQGVMPSEGLQDMPPWHVSQWFNTSGPLQVSDLRPKVVLIHTFQMLCPGCVMQAVPQAIKIHRLFASDDFAVIGLHTVFEHHDAMQPHALKAFLHEYRVPFPVGVDEPTATGIPRTMRQLGLQGTPSALLLDRHGRIRMNHFGQIDDLQLGYMIGRLVSEPVPDMAKV